MVMTPLNQTSNFEWYAAFQVTAIMRMLAILKNVGNFSLIIVYTENSTPNDLETLCTTLPYLGILKLY